MRHRGFSLLELLVVIGLAAGLLVVFARPPSGDIVSSVDAARAALVGTLAEARLRAMSRGADVRLLIHADTGDRDRSGFRRSLVLQEEGSSGAWTTFERLSLPEGVAVLPHRLRIPVGFYADVATWKDPASGAPLNSSALAQLPITLAIDTDPAVAWDVVTITSQGTTGNGGALFVAAVVPRPGAAQGQSPIEARVPENARGVALSSYGIANAL